MKYDLEMYNCEPGSMEFQATLIELGVGPVARVRKRPAFSGLPPGMEMSPGAKVPPLPTQVVDDNDIVLSSFEYNWFEPSARERFLIFLRNIPCTNIENIPKKESMSEAQIDGIRMDTMIANLLDLIWIRHNKNLAKTNTLYRLDTDEAGTVRIAPNPNDDTMRRALDLVYGEGCAIILNDTLPDKPEELFEFSA